jgi:Family of unknown function (DUF6459)
MVESTIRAQLNKRELERRAQQRTAVRPHLPTPVHVAAAIARALCEVEAGLRPIEQLERISHPTLWPSLEARVRRSGGPPVTATSLLRVHIQEIERGLVEAVAIVRRGPRFQAIAMRLDGADGHWEIVELQY